MFGRPITIRTLDLRTEKLFALAVDPRSDGQTWDWRLVDQLPHVQDLVRVQLQRFCGVANTVPVRILFPMITTQRQLECALRLVEEARHSLEEEETRRADGAGRADGRSAGSRHDDSALGPARGLCLHWLQ